MEDYLKKILLKHDLFRNEEIQEFNDIVTLDLSEINIFRVKNKFMHKDIDGLKILKNVKSIPQASDWLGIYFIRFKNGKSFLLGIADPFGLFEDPYLLLQQEI